MIQGWKVTYNEESLDRPYTVKYRSESPPPHPNPLLDEEREKKGNPSQRGNKAGRPWVAGGSGANHDEEHLEALERL